MALFAEGAWASCSLSHWQEGKEEKQSNISFAPDKNNILQGGMQKEAEQKKKLNKRRGAHDRN